MKYTQSEKGFTIIETSLVLAIAGLILVMAFVALPALQRQTRDAKRKEDAATFMQALTKYQENNRGQLPTYTINTTTGFDSDSSVQSWDSASDLNTWVKFYNDYLGNDFNNPNGERYTFSIVDKNVFDNESYSISQVYELADFTIFMGGKCQNNGIKAVNNRRSVAMMVSLETGGNYCVDN